MHLHLIAALLTTDAGVSPPGTDPLPAACGRDAVAIVWTQPPRLPVDHQQAVRVPTDGTVRLAFAGNACPEASQFTLHAADGTPVPAQVRVRSPWVLGRFREASPTLLEIQPMAPMAEKADYTLTWRVPLAELSEFTTYSLTFRTATHATDPLDADAFEGIRAVEPFTANCAGEGNAGGVIRGGMGPPGCDEVDRLLLAVRYVPVDRPDVAYVIERVSSTAEDGARDDRPLAIGYEAGVDLDVVSASHERRSVVTVPVAPAPRRDCFRVRMLDHWGRAHGDASATACIDLPGDFACPIPATTIEPSGPMPLRACGAIGLHGGDARREPPPDDGSGSGSGSEGDGGGGGGCDVAGAPSALPGLLLLGGLLRRRRFPTARPRR
jgi:hypothetical protein